ncbi:MAG TPA: hypothetical protein VGE06_08545, partial [Flavisolibacter sp.]
MKSLPFRPLALLALTFCFLGFVHPPVPDPSFPAFWKDMNKRLYPADRSLSGMAKDNTFTVNCLLFEQLINMRAQTGQALRVPLVTTPFDAGTFSRYGSLDNHASRIFYAGTAIKPLTAE